MTGMSDRGARELIARCRQALAAGPRLEGLPTAERSERWAAYAGGLEYFAEAMARLVEDRLEPGP
jgi:hypothetical protein